MKSFVPEPRMYTLQGVFYPTGHIVIMFPTGDGAVDAEKMLLHSGYDAGAICLLTPKDIHEKIAAKLEDEDNLPSPGTEAATARHFEDLARAGHHALLVAARSTRDCARVMEALKGANISYAQRYRHFVIEDLVT